jgi:hypothetical protein
MMTNSGAQPEPGAGPRAPIEKGDRAIALARARRERCLECGAGHDGAVTSSLEGRVRAYRAAHPEHQFIRVDASGIVAVIVRRSCGPEIVALADDLHSLLDMVGAPQAEGLS